MNFQPLGDRLLVERIPAPEKQNGVIILPPNPRHAPAEAGPQLAEGIVLAVGTGKWIDGEWWRLKPGDECPEHPGMPRVCGCEWYWETGYRQMLEVYPGQRVLFNARWNDFGHDELKGSDCDMKGPLERPLPIGHDPLIHLITEGDIAGILE